MHLDYLAARTANHLLTGMALIMRTHAKNVAIHLANRLRGRG